MKEPRISATDAALTRIEQVRVNRKQPQAGLRTAITGRENAAILDTFPDIHEVRDTTDHAQGANPYYQAAKK